MRKVEDKGTLRFAEEKPTVRQCIKALVEPSLLDYTRPICTKQGWPL